MMCSFSGATGAKVIANQPRKNTAIHCLHQADHNVKRVKATVKAGRQTRSIHAGGFITSVSRLGERAACQYWMKVLTIDPSTCKEYSPLDCFGASVRCSATKTMEGII